MVPQGAPNYRIRQYNKNAQMAFVTWTKDLKIGIDFIDADHKVLVELLNQVDACIAAREESATLGSALNALLEYARHHFRREELLLELCAFPEIDRHRVEHKRLASELAEFNRRFAESPDAVETDYARAFLHRWFVDHLRHHDAAFRDACRDHYDAAMQAAAVRFGTSEGRPPRSDWSGLKVLVIDDNPHFRELAATILKTAGAGEVTGVASAAAGLAHWKSHGADVVLCDWLMDRTDGIQFAAQAGVRAARAIVLVTGFGDEAFRQRAAAAGIRHFLEKPITAKALLETVARAVADDKGKN